MRISAVFISAANVVLTGQSTAPTISIYADANATPVVNAVDMTAYDDFWTYDFTTFDAEVDYDIKVNDSENSLTGYDSIRTNPVDVQKINGVTITGNGKAIPFNV